MKESTLDLVYETLDDKIFYSRRKLQNVTGLSKACITNATDVLLSDEAIEKIYVRYTLTSGRAEVCYRRKAQKE